MPNRFREKLANPDEFVLTFELVPGKDSRGKSVAKVLSFAQQAQGEGIIDALSITDNAGGNPSLSPDVLGKEIQQMGIDPIVHFACRDWNRYGAFSRALQLDRLGIDNLLVVTGDYPIEGPAGTAEPCFDLDSVTMMCMLDRMNRGKQTFCTKATADKEERTNFVLGSPVSCFKSAESEVLNQYDKLLKKVCNGAQFIITQLCYDARKFHELLQFLRNHNIDVPLLGSVYVLKAGAARFMKAGNVPGVYIPDKLHDQIIAEAAAPDKGKKASLTRAAKLMAILKGLGYRGTHLAGSVSYDDVREIVRTFHEIQDNWREFLPEFDLPFPGGFYLYERDDSTGLNGPSLAHRPHRSVSAYCSHAVMKVFHHLLFNKNAPQYKLFKRNAGLIDKTPILSAILGFTENTSKSLLFDCRKCGDCALQDMAYLCPESQCPKNMRNGPCGGSTQTRCEVRKEKTCVWCKVYDRLRAHGAEANLTGPCLPPRNWALDNTSAWLNFYLDRDHSATLAMHCDRFNLSKED